MKKGKRGEQSAEGFKMIPLYANSSLLYCIREAWLNYLGWIIYANTFGFFPSKGLFLSLPEIE